MSNFNDLALASKWTNPARNFFRGRVRWRKFCVFAGPDDLARDRRPRCCGSGPEAPGRSSPDRDGPSTRCCIITCIIAPQRVIETKQYQLVNVISMRMMYPHNSRMCISLARSEAGSRPTRTLGEHPTGKTYTSGCALAWPAHGRAQHFGQKPIHWGV